VQRRCIAWDEEPVSAGTPALLPTQPGTAPDPDQDRNTLLRNDRIGIHAHSRTLAVSVIPFDNSIPANPFSTLSSDRPDGPGRVDTSRSCTRCTNVSWTANPRPCANVPWSPARNRTLHRQSARSGIQDERPGKIDGPVAAETNDRDPFGIKVQLAIKRFRPRIPWQP